MSSKLKYNKISIIDGYEADNMTLNKWSYVSYIFLFIACYITNNLNNIKNTPKIYLDISETILVTTIIDTKL